MPNSYAIAGQAAPVAATDTTLYTVEAATQFSASTLAVVNRDKTVGADAAEFRVAIVPQGDTLANKHYLEFDRFLEPRDSYKMTIGITLPAGASVIVRSSTANLSFSLFGAKITASS